MEMLTDPQHGHQHTASFTVTGDTDKATIANDKTYFIA